MRFAYLGALLVSTACVLLVDYRYRLFAFRHPRDAALVVAAGTALLLIADLAGIAAGIFLVGGSPALSGVMLAPHLPLEEPVFLAFLCLLTMVVHTGALRLLTRAPEREPEPGHEAAP